MRFGQNSAADCPLGILIWRAYSFVNLNLDPDDDIYCCWGHL